MTVLLNASISSTCFGQLFAHRHERLTVFCSLRYNAPNLCRLVAWMRRTCLSDRCEGCCWTESSNSLHTDHLSGFSASRLPADTTAVHYTSNCRTQSSAHEDGQLIARNMLHWLEQLIKLSFFNGLLTMHPDTIKVLFANLMHNFYIKSIDLIKKLCIKLANKTFIKTVIVASSSLSILSISRMHGQSNIKLINSFSLKLILLIREIIQKCQLNNTRCDSTSGTCKYHLL